MEMVSFSLRGNIILLGLDALLNLAAAHVFAEEKSFVRAVISSSWMASSFLPDGWTELFYLPCGWKVLFLG